MKMKRAMPRACLSIVVASLSLAGCDGTEVKLADVPPAPIAPNKQAAESQNKSDLKLGAPPKGSSSGMNRNPSDSGPPR